MTFGKKILEIQKNNSKNLGLDISETSSLLELAQRADGLHKKLCDEVFCFCTSSAIYFDPFEWLPS